MQNAYSVVPKSVSSEDAQVEPKPRLGRAQFRIIVDGGKNKAFRRILRISDRSFEAPLISI